MVLKMPSRRITGVYVSGETVSAISLRGERIEWMCEMSRDPDGDPLAVLLCRLLKQLPRTRLARPRVAVGVGPAAAQVRNVGTIAGGRDRRLVEAIVATNAGRFFLVNGIPVVTTGAQWAPDGGAWVGAVERPIIDAVAEACAHANVQLAVIAPAAASLGRAVQGGAMTLADGEVLVTVSYQGDLLDRHRREFSAMAVADTDGVSFLAPLAALGEDARRFAPAYGIARASVSVSLRVDPLAYTERSYSGIRLTLATCILALAFAATVPALAARVRSDAALRELHHLGGTRLVLEARERELADKIGLLHDLERFEASRRSTTLLLAALTEAIAHPTVLQSLQADTLGGTIVAATPRAAALVAMLDSVPAITGAHLVGPVTQEPRATARALGPAMPMPAGEPSEPMERVTVRFAWREPFGKRGVR
jgi:hypothetical protein